MSTLGWLAVGKADPSLRLPHGHCMSTGPQAAPLRMTPSSKSSDAQLFSTRFADAMRGPFGFPHKIYFYFADVGDGGKAVIYLLEDQP